MLRIAEEGIVLDIDHAPSQQPRHLGLQHLRPRGRKPAAQISTPLSGAEIRDRCRQDPASTRAQPIRGFAAAASGAAAPSTPYLTGAAGALPRPPSLAGVIKQKQVRAAPIVPLLHSPVP